MTKPRGLFITEYYSNGPLSPPSNSQHVIYGSLTSADLIDYRPWYYDANGSDYHLASIAAGTIGDFDFVLVQPLFRGTQNPSIEDIKRFKDKGIKVAYMWPDSTSNWAHDQMKDLDFIDLHITLDAPRRYGDWKTPCIFTWSPQDDRLYNCTLESIRDPFNYRDIMISMMGRWHHVDRVAILKSILQKYPNTYAPNGSLSPEQYVLALRRSFLTVNTSFSSAFQRHQLKGRTVEATLSGACLCETSNHLTRHFFKPGEEYIEFNTAEDLVNIIEGDIDIPTIAEAGWRRATENYNSKKYWQLILDSLGF